MAKKQGHTLEVGAIVYHSWGYEQTNVDFYQVVGRTQHFVKIRPIKSKTVKRISDMAGEVVPVKDSFSTSEIERRKVSEWQGRQLVKMFHGHGEEWDGKPKYESSYA